MGCILQGFVLFFLGLTPKWAGAGCFSKAGLEGMRITSSDLNFRFLHVFTVEPDSCIFL